MLLGSNIRLVLFMFFVVVAVLFCFLFWLVLPCTERKNVIRFNCIVFTDFQRTKLHSFQNILKISQISALIFLILDILILRRHKHKGKDKHKDQIFPFPCACAYAYVCAATSQNEIPLRHSTSTRMFTTRGYVWPVKTLDLGYLPPNLFGMFGWLCLCMCLRRISFRIHCQLQWTTIYQDDYRGLTSYWVFCEVQLPMILEKWTLRYCVWRSRPMLFSDGIGLHHSLSYTTDRRFDTIYNT